MTLQNAFEGLATEAKQSRFAPYVFANVDEPTEGTVYVQKTHNADPALWVIARYVDGPTTTAATYAGPTNNPTIMSASSAWSDRATLVYGAAAEA
jgi:hypothetical protein